MRHEVRSSVFMAVRGRRDRGGSTLVVFFVLIIVSGSITLLLDGARRGQVATSSSIEQERALLNAECGVRAGIAELQSGVDFAGDGVGNAVGIVNGGGFTVNLMTSPAGGASYLLRAVGTYGRARRIIEAVAGEVSDVSPLMIGLTEVKIGGGIVDSYSSAAGYYAPYDHGGGILYQGEDGHVVSNGPIVPSGSALICGDAVPGVGCQVSDPSLVLGSTTPASENIVLDPYVYDPPVQLCGTLAPESGAELTITSGVYRYDTVSVGGGGVVTISGNVVIYCDDKFTFSGGSMIVLAEGASLEIHHGTNDFVVGGGGIVNPSERPGNCQIWSATTSSLKYTGGSDLHGEIYVPGALCEFSGGGDMFGSVRAGRIVFSGGSSFHADVSLLDTGKGGIVLLGIRELSPKLLSNY